MKYFIQLSLPPRAFLSLTVKQNSWIPAPGHTQPQKALPKNSDTINKSPKVIKLPVIIPCAAPSMMM